MTHGRHNFSVFGSKLNSPTGAAAVSCSDYPFWAEMVWHGKVMSEIVFFILLILDLFWGVGELVDTETFLIWKFSSNRPTGPIRS